MSTPIYKPVSQKLSAGDTAHVSPRVDVHNEGDARCGFWVCKPAYMQPLAKMGVFAGFYGFANMLTQTLTYYVNSQITTLERQFGFSSHQTGIIMAANDVGFLACVLFAAHLASRTHIPRSLGVTNIVFGISGLACSLPHFLFGAISKDPTTENINSTESNFSKQSAVLGSMCDMFNNTIDRCGTTAAQNNPGQTVQTSSERVSEISFVIIVIGMCLQGFGKSPRIAYSLLYVDDNTDKVNTGFYAGIMTAVAVLGPVSAFLLGGVFSRMYVTLGATQLTPRHPKWIGAWWLGFVVFGLLAVLAAIPLFCFPRKMPRNKVLDAQLNDKSSAGNDDIINPTCSHTSMKQSHEDRVMAGHIAPSNKRFRFKSLLKHGREFMGSQYRLLVNPVYVCVVISSCFHIFMSAGSSAFYPKYLERVFNFGIHTANYITAGTYLSTSFAGVLIGGFLSRRYKMTAMTGLRFTSVMVGLSALSQFMTLIFKCDHPTIQNWPGRDSENNSCNSGCNCRDNTYFPICGGDGRTYYSPCHAGCLQAELGIYQNCSCILGGQATAGVCDYACSHLYGYVIIGGLRLVFTTLAVIPKLVIFMRCVPENDRSMALSMLPFMTSLFGWLMSPIFFGSLIDNACMIWDIKCHTKGRCLLYDNNLFRVKFHGYGGLCLTCSFLFLLIAYAYARWTKCLDTDPKDKDVQNKVEMTLVVNGSGTVDT